MSSPAQIIANQENSKLSTGPRTAEGKAASSQNHVTHGFTAVDPVLPTEDRNQFNALLNRFMADQKPSNIHEESLVQEMAAARWKLNRLVRIETAMFAALDNPEKAFTDKQTAASFARLDRYRASIERTYHRCARELRASRKEQNEANAAQIAGNKFDGLVKRLANAPPPGYQYEPRLVETPAAEKDSVRRPLVCETA